MEANSASWSEFALQLLVYAVDPLSYTLVVGKVIA